jgi:hypothetical protein
MTQWGLDVLFNPAKRHMDEEKQRLQTVREEVGDNSKGDRIDLTSGKVTIRRKAKEANQSEADQAEDAPAAEEIDDEADAEPAATETVAAVEAELEGSADGAAGGS